jgi:Mg-chelatase subunit ChlD
MTKPRQHAPLRVATDRRLIRSRWHSERFIVARVDAPVATTDGTRPPVNLAFVLDRSGSMSGHKLQVAARAVEEGIGRLQPTDRFSIVWFDSDVDVLVPGTLATGSARRAAIERLRGVGPGGSTNLSGGWLAGCEQVATAPMESGVNRVLLLTDGQANVGMIEPAELAHHAAELRLRGVSTSTFGVGDDFQEALLQGMAQAGGGHFYDIADAAAIADHLSTEIGESLEVVARDVELRLTLPDGVRVESLGAFPAIPGEGGTVIALGDLVSGQSVEVPLRLSFPVGKPTETHSAVIALGDRDGVLGGAFGKLSWEHAEDAANDIQPRDRSVDRVIAKVFAARARQEAVQRNRMGDYRGARAVLEATARRIRSYAGDDLELRQTADELLREAEMFEHVMPERSRKVAYAQSAYALQSRLADGAAFRSAR